MTTGYEKYLEKNLKTSTTAKFCVIALIYCSIDFVFELFASSVLRVYVFVFCHNVTAYSVL
jgi:uncharacterized membrane protein YbaN (DUF454 family)